MLKPISKTEAIDAEGFDTSVLDIFYNYDRWPQSSSLKTDDTTAQSLYILSRTMIEGEHHNTNPQSLTDINGDGLADILYHYRSYNDTFSFFYAAILLNQGGLNFDLTYKCVSDIGRLIYYGDCAQL